MNNFYVAAATEFETRIADLRPRDAYNQIRQLALGLAQDGFSSLPAQFAIPANTSGHGQRRPEILAELQRAYALYAHGILKEAFEIARRVAESAEIQQDPLSGIDALHLQGRIHLDVDRFGESAACFAEEMDRSQRTSCVPGFIRAVHEASRACSELRDLVRAEFGFRLAWDYYTASMMLGGPQGGSDAPGSNSQNAQAAIRCLRSLSELYVLFERGPIEADALLQRLASPHFSNRDLSGAAFLETRGLATLCLALIPRHRPILARMASRAMALHGGYPRISAFMLEEAEFVADLCDDPFPRAVRRVLLKSAAVRTLRSAPFYKGSTVVFSPDAGESPFRTADSAAEDASVLYRYLADADANGRYVYRGQTADYPGPLLPSAFRQILTDGHGRTVKTESDGLYDRFCLRNCGRRFYGEYNACFQRYADPVSHLVQLGVSEDKVQAARAVYRRVLEDPGIPLAQEGERFVPWIDALRRVLSAEEFTLFADNSRNWMLRIDNYHRRLYRSERFVALFGYTLGTTFAQQYGFSSEGLDATKSLDVAFFFATHDSADFASITNKGVGVIYRFPFPPNDVAASPLGKYDYYSLPSIVDVKDVIYRFEIGDLERSDSRMCLDTYIGASFIDGFQDQNLIFLPEGFYEATRVAKQDAVIIFPDELREDHLDREPGIGGIRFPKYRYIEDLAAREGVEKFYFRHTSGAPSNTATITREDLWPRDDVLLDLVVRIILGTYRLRYKHPKRPELIDVGYDNEAFSREASDRYWADRPVFFTEYERIGAQFGALTM